MITIGEASKILGVTPKTLRLWEKEGKITSHKTKGNHRRYLMSDLLGFSNKDKITIGYARVSSQGQKKDLNRQEQLLEFYCTGKAYNFKIIIDLGSGLNYKKKGLNSLIKMICSNEIGRLVLVHKDRLLRFGSELIFSLCEQFGVEVVIVNKSQASTFEEELASDVLEIITVFSTRLYGSRSHKNKKIIDQLQEIAKEIKG